MLVSFVLSLVGTAGTLANEFRSIRKGDVSEGTA